MKRKLLTFLSELTEKLQARWSSESNKPDGIIIAFIARTQTVDETFDKRYYARAEGHEAFERVNKNHQPGQGHRSLVATLVHSFLDGEDHILEQSGFIGLTGPAKIGTPLFLHACSRCGSPAWRGNREARCSNCYVCMAPPQELPGVS